MGRVQTLFAAICVPRQSRCWRQQFALARQLANSTPLPAQRVVRVTGPSTSAGGAIGRRRYLDHWRRTFCAERPLPRDQDAPQDRGGLERPHWKLFDYYTRRNATAAFSEI